MRPLPALQRALGLGAEVAVGRDPERLLQAHNTTLASRTRVAGAIRAVRAGAAALPTSCS
jgi:hypothetical protein